MTAPLWRILESQLTISELGKEHRAMCTHFVKWSSDASTLLTEGLGKVDDDNNPTQIY